MTTERKDRLATAIIGMVAGVAGAALTLGLFWWSAQPVAPAPTPTAPASVTLAPTQSTAPVARVEYETAVMRIAEDAAASIVGISVEIPAGIFARETGSGSGIIMSEDGYILTNNHVVCDSSGHYVNGTRLTVYRIGDQRAYPARLIGRDSQSDLAVLKIEQDGLPTVRFGDSDAVRVGQLAVAIGNPAGLKFMGSVTSGVVSGLDREVVLENGVAMRLIQTDAAINPGNSGGALLDSGGQVIGVNNAGLAKSEYEGVNFAIPANLAWRMYEELKQGTGQSARPYLGVTILQDAEYAGVKEQYGLPDAGIYVARVLERGPAEAAGILAGDVITAWNGEAMRDVGALAQALARHQPGDRVTLTLFRSGRAPWQLEITLGERFD